MKITAGSARTITLLGILGMVLAASATASPVASLHPNLQRGVGIEGRYETQDYPSADQAINLFNGNLSLRLQIGQSFPLDQGDVYSLRLAYNSQAWDISDTGVATPARFSNAGLGWDLSFGHVLEPGEATNPTGRWIFIDSSGTWHPFHSDLHPDTPDTDDPNDQVLYTRDSTYIRLHQTDATRVNLVFPSRRAMLFDKIDGVWKLTRVWAQGRANRLDVSYAPDDSSWTLTDTHGRTHRVYFQVEPTTGAILVDRVELAAFGGATATYTFAYTTATVSPPCGTTGTSQTVALLASITDPTGYVQDFTYHTGAAATCRDGGLLASAELTTGGLLAYDYGAYTFPPSSCSGATPAYLTETSGVAEIRTENPLGGLVGKWQILRGDLTRGSLQPVSDPCEANERRIEVLTPLGDRHKYFFSVATKINTDSSGRTIGGPAEYGLPIGRNWLTASPDGNRYLSQQIYDCNSSGTGCVHLRNVWESWEQDELCNSFDESCFATNRRRKGERIEYRDEVQALGSATYEDRSFEDFDGLGNYRRVGVTTTAEGGVAKEHSFRRSYNPGRGVYVPTEGSYDGPSSQTSTFSMLPTAWKWVLDDYSLERWWDSVLGQGEERRYCFDSEGHMVRKRLQETYGVLGANDVIVEYTISGGQVVRESYYGGDTQTVPTSGTWCSAALSNPQYVLERTYTSGALATQFHVDPTGARLYAEGDVQRSIDPSTGLTSKTWDAAGLETSYTYDVLGRLTWMRPSAAHGGASTQYTYRDPIAGGTAWSHGRVVREYRRANDGTGTLARKITWISFFGDRAGEQILMPGNRWSRKRWEPNSMGWLQKKTTSFEPGVTGGKWTHYLDYDPFGRARIIRPPEGSSHDTVIQYFGARKKVTTRQAGRAFAGASSGPGNCYENPVTETVEFDHQGRVSRTVTDRPMPSPGETVVSSTSFDPVGRVVERRTDRTVDGSTSTTIQRSSFDDRGFLLSTQGYFGGRWGTETQYLQRDAKGLEVKVRKTGLHYPDPVDTLLNRDRAGRTVRIVDAGDPAIVFKEFDYATANSGTNHQRSKLTRAARYNYPLWDVGELGGSRDTRGAALVENTYQYAGVGGRVSRQDFSAQKYGEFSNPAHLPKHYRDELAYDQLGRVIQRTYPHCLTCGTAEPQLPRKLTYTHQFGYMTALQGEEEDRFFGLNWDGSFDWDPAGRRVERATHANGVVDVYRPGLNRDTEYDSISVDGLNANNCGNNCFSFDSGPFVYDGEGAVCGIGTGSRVLAPTAPPSSFPYDSTSCSANRVLDPFGAFVKRYADGIDSTQCHTRIETYYDAFDRVVVVSDLSAQHQVLVAGSWVWRSNGDAYFVRWSLYGADGTFLREVTDGHPQEWWNTHDRIYGPLGLHGRERKVRNDWYSPPYQTVIRHVHPMTIYETQGPSGYKMDPGTDDFEPQIQ